MSGFFGRRDRREDRDPRLPPGQYDTGSGFPVLTAEPTPGHRPRRVDVPDRRAGRRGAHLDLADLQRLPGDTYEGDIHCVTTWSKLDTNFTGVSLDTLIDESTSPTTRATSSRGASTGYTTNLPIEDVTDGKAWLVWDHEGQPLPPEHGGPVRMLVPHLYFWKSTKWVARSAVPRPRRARLLGGPGLPRPGRPMARAAVHR